jgi:nucleoside-triphosphatase THEP1
MKVTVSGPQGCGKTTLADIIALALMDHGYAVDRRQEGMAAGGSCHAEERERITVDEVQE